MKKLHYLLYLLIGLCGACQDEIENIAIQHPLEKDEAYFQNLRDYKASDHAIICGWFKNWTAKGPCRVNYLDGLPDSLDMVFLGWGGWENMDEDRLKDLRYVQKNKATKVLISFVITDIGNHMTPDNYEGDQKDFWGWVDNDPSTYEAAIRKYANAICDSVYKHDFDGFDLDYEPHAGGNGNLASYPDRMAILVEELGKRLGPESKTGKYLVIDGETLDPSVAEKTTKYFNYFVEQAYGATSCSLLDLRYDKAKKALFPPEKYVPAVNYEKWQSGGGDFRDPERGTLPAILGFVYWNPQEGRKGGVGALNIENDYKQPGRDYDNVRKAIQIMNPAQH